MYNEKITALETTEQLHHQLLIDRVTTCDHSITNFELEFARSMEKAEIQRLRLDDLHKNFEDMSKRIDILEMKVNNMPPDIAIINDELAIKKTEMSDMLAKASTIMGNMSKQDVSSEEFNKVKITCASNAEQLNQIQHDSKKRNLLVTNLRLNLHHTQGLIDFCYHELNVELNFDDISSFTKIFDSATRIVHLVRFKGIDSRNVV